MQTLVINSQYTSWSNRIDAILAELDQADEDFCINVIKDWQYILIQERLTRQLQRAIKAREAVTKLIDLPREVEGTHKV